VFQHEAETDDNESPHRAKQLLVLVKGISAIGFKRKPAPSTRRSIRRCIG
jgi:hypothetical protein